MLYFWAKLRLVGYEYALLNELRTWQLRCCSIAGDVLEGSRTWEGDAVGFTMYQSGGAENKLMIGFIVLGKMRSRVINWEPINGRMCRSKI